MKVIIEKDIYVRDKYRVKRQAFVAGQEVELGSYYNVLATNSVVNPEDLPIVPDGKKVVKRSMHSTPMETKVLDFNSSVEEEVVRSEKSEEDAKEKTVAEASEDTAISVEDLRTVAFGEKDKKPRKSKKDETVVDE